MAKTLLKLPSVCVTYLSYLSYLSYLCCPCLRKKREPEISLEYLISLCESGDLPKLKLISKETLEPYLQDCLSASVNKFETNVSEFLINNGAKPTNAMMKHACENNKYELVKLLLKNGIKPQVVYRYSKSSNILNMTSRFENNSENII